jgi:hypothetical protein
MRPVTKRGRGNGLMLAGILVILIWLGVMAFRALEIPRYWMPAVVGIVLVALGAILRAGQRRRPWPRT